VLSRPDRLDASRAAGSDGSRRRGQRELAPPSRRKEKYKSQPPDSKAKTLYADDHVIPYRKVVNDQLIPYPLDQRFP
jgi:hypothetical protein